MSIKPMLIAFEGTECAGKTTAMAQLKKHIEDTYGVEVVVTRAPGGTPVGTKIREIIVGSDHSEMSKTTNALLFAADYRHTLETLVVPALKRGAVVITDRINLTMRVYQNTAEAEALAKMNDKIVTPDLIFVMTTPYDVFVKRRNARDASLNNARDYIEKDVHDGYVERYVTYADTHPSTCAVIDCLGEQSEVIKEVISTFTRRARA